MSKTMTRGVCAVWAAALLSTACASGKDTRPSEPSRDPAAYMPLAVGNRWTYERKYLGETGEHTVEIVGQKDGFYVDNTGASLSVDAYGVRDRNRYLLRHPLEAGKQWSNVVSVSSMERYQILDVGFTCEVPAGTFQDCVRVQAKNRIDKTKTMVNEITFAPGVGMVRFELFLETGEQRVPQGTITLKSYSLAGKPSPQGA